MIFSIELATKTFEVAVEYKDIKNIYLRLVSSHQLKITCSPLISKSYILSFIEGKEDWILESIKKLNNRQLITKMAIVDHKVYYLGQAYPIIWKYSERRKIKKIDNIYYLEGPLSDESSLLRQFYEFHKEDVLKIMFSLRDKYDRIIQDYQLELPLLKVKYLTGRHGQCVVNKKEITLSSRMIHFDIQCIDYVLWHEYCHLIVPNHSKRFYQVLENKMPQYKSIKDMIR